MKGQYFIFSNAGHIESGNDLPPNEQIVGAIKKADAEKKFKAACDQCEEYYEDQCSIVRGNSSLLQDTSAFYWWVILLKLPGPIDYTEESISSEIRMNLEGCEDVAKLVVFFAGESVEREDVLEHLQEWVEVSRP